MDASAQHDRNDIPSPANADPGPAKSAMLAVPGRTRRNAMLACRSTDARDGSRGGELEYQASWVEIRGDRGRDGPPSRAGGDSRTVTLNEHPVLAIAAIGGVGVICQWVGWRLRVPSILFLLLAGVAIGPVGGWLDPDLLFGQALLPLVSLAVSVILFEGALTLRFAEIVGLETVIRRMVTSGVLLSWVVIAAAVRWLVGLSWNLRRCWARSRR